MEANSGQKKDAEELLKEMEAERLEMEERFTIKVCSRRNVRKSLLRHMWLVSALVPIVHCAPRPRCQHLGQHHHVCPDIGYNTGPGEKNGT